MGYRSFVPLPGGVTAGGHPERVRPGGHPGRGLVLSGPVRASHPAGGGWEAGLAVGAVTVWCRLLEPPPAEMTVTVAGAQCFGPDGNLLPEAGPGAGGWVPGCAAAARSEGERP